jgi:hypothetical protein
LVFPFQASVSTNSILRFFLGGVSGAVFDRYAVFNKVKKNNIHQKVAVFSV